MEQHDTAYEPSGKVTAYEGFTRRNNTGEAAFKHFLSVQSKPIAQPSEKQVIIVIGKHRYYNLFSAQLAEVQVSHAGELKNPITILNPIELAWQTQQPEELKFYTAIMKLQNFYEKSATDFMALQSLVNNPFNYAFYLHDSSISEKITSRSIFPVQVSQPAIDFKIQVSLDEDFYTVKGAVKINGSFCPLSRIQLKFDYFLVLDNLWYFSEKQNLMDSIGYFRKQQHDIVLPPDEFLRFNVEVLSQMEDDVPIEHTYLRPASKSQLQQAGFNEEPERLIYLSDMEDYVMLNPVLRYRDKEVSVLSTKPLFIQDHTGELLGVERNKEAEDALMTLFLVQHPDFMEQLESPLPYFYLHKNCFLDENWFLNAFDAWDRQGIKVLGFNELKGNKLNQHKARIHIQVASGLNWFNAEVAVRYGKKKASLTQLHRAVKDKSKYVELGDGSLGILPEEWLRKFESYFAAGTIEEDTLKIPKTNYTVLAELYEQHMLDEQVRQEVAYYSRLLSDVKTIPAVPAPEELQTTLRPYQLQGLSWLHFLDNAGFGGCLADDMGLGKSVQVIAFMLLLKGRPEKGAHLLVVPTSLLYNWKAEIGRFAPGLKLYVLHGADRAKTADSFDSYDVVMTTYGTLVSDISFLRQYRFHYVFLDESQNIKNIASQRYKAARLLQSRNRIVLSGTPLENNTFDIYAQLSFACPGLLGSRNFFRNTYAIPIDKFKDRRSSAALQARISPFILRRTKQEVATELPEKTEVILYCEMGPEQRKIYDAYEKEFREFISASTEEELPKQSVHVLAGITRLRQICNSPLLLGEDGLYSESSAKIEMLLEQVRAVSKTHKILVFSQFVSMLDLIRKELVKEEIKHAYLTGSTRNRGEVVSRFQEDDATRVFLISLKAGGTGLNLTAADYVFIVDPWWNPAVENQAIDRSYRIGQQKNVIAARLVCPDTVEEKILIMQKNKAKLASNLVQSDDRVFRNFSKQDWLGLTKP
ncbi:DEAD/DEAH box helicase [Pontibacter sp. SGAir0037]|uniref:DEAD/DEAH box helicase n=1 Tax=Pontibacter sp. SGAir0037 TaxID=2571030 RepID=UPI0010CD6598|nr:DEAD/DEAH box helicase [Pontibacter sp. SGAir0037]QCR22459.1 DNA helicase [Pontibacter sp. SGAir0037]